MERKKSDISDDIFSDVEEERFISFMRKKIRIILFSAVKG